MEIKVYEDRQGRSMTERQKRTVWNALLVAAERFDASAQQMREAQNEAQGRDVPSVALAYGRMADQFESQARESRELIETFE